VCFTAQEFAVGVGGQRLNEASVRIKEAVLPGDENMSKWVLFHHHPSYAIAQLYNPGLNWSIHCTAQDSLDEE
jgi:hypothetical protein